MKSRISRIIRILLKFIYKFIKLMKQKEKGAILNKLQ